MIEQLLNYGVLGLWTATLLHDRYKQQKETKTIILNNTLAFNKVANLIKNCKKK